MKVLMIRNIALFFFSIMIIGSRPMMAQDVAESETAGAEESRFERELRLEEITRLEEAKVLPSEEAYQEEREEEIPSGWDAELTFVLKDVVFSGNETLSSEKLYDAASRFIGEEVNFQDIKNLARQIKLYYRSRGYIAAYVYLPPQTVKDGVVEFAVIEGRIGNIEIQGNKWFSTKVLSRMLNIAAEHVVFYNELRGALSFLNKNRDIEAKAVLKPGIEPETTDLEINIKDEFPIHLSTDVNNLGTDNTGRERWGISLTHTNLLGQMDQLFARFQIGSGAWAVGTDYSIPINSYHTRIGASYSRAAIDVGGDFKALDVEGEATTYGVYVLQPVIYGGALETTLRVGFDWKSVENRILGSVSGEDELRILNIGINNEMTDSWGRTLSPHSFHFGFSSFLGGDDKTPSNPSRALSEAQFFVYRGSLIRYQRLPWKIIYSFRGVWQLTPDRLAPSEQLRLGGAFSIRGYPEGEYLADYGAFITNEILVPTYFFPKDWKLPFSDRPLQEQIQAVGFFDFGGGSLRRALAGEDSSRSMAGIGGGVRMHLFDKVYARFHWATPIGSRSSDGANSQFYYGISAELL